jgi:Ras family protein T1
VYRTIATPGSHKDKKDKTWIAKHYLTFSLVAGVVIITSFAGYKLWKHHFSSHGLAAAAVSAAKKKKEYS